MSFLEAIFRGLAAVFNVTWQSKTVVLRIQRHHIHVTNSSTILRVSWQPCPAILKTDKALGMRLPFARLAK